MPEIFCCSRVAPYKPRGLDHEVKFTAFTEWARSHTATNDQSQETGQGAVGKASHAFQLVRQVNYGPLESLRYFIPAGDGYAEAIEETLVNANFEKLNTYKNFTCSTHNKFFEINLYQKNPNNTHHWRATLERPSTRIDLAHRAENAATTCLGTDREVGRETMRRPPSPRPRQIATQTYDSTTSQAPRVQSGTEQDQSTTKKPVSDESKQKSDGELDVAGLKALLRFVLPVDGARHDPDRILRLLAIDWINDELALSLDVETQWDAELTTSNIARFLHNRLDRSIGAGVDLLGIEELVIRAARRTGLADERFWPGRTRLQRTVCSVFEQNPTVDWVLKNSVGIPRILKRGPDTGLLDCVRECSSSSEQDKDVGAATRLVRPPTPTPKNINTWAQEETDYPRGSPGSRSDWDDDGDYSSYSYGDDHEPMGDFTACDKECGYCGRCDY